MPYIKNESLIGKWVTTTERLESCDGYFTKGSRVKITACDERGYDIEDSSGNHMCECGFGFFDEGSILDTE